MARTKLCICCALLLVIAIIPVIIYFSIKCPRGTFRNAAVATDAIKCSEIGRDILQRGGSAVDGAIAALLCTGIMNPQSAGIGGGSMFTVMDSSGNVKIINSRETAPSNMNSDRLKFCPRSSTMLADGNGIWIGVPGEIRGYEMAHKLYGKLPWADLFQPTIKLAREGFPIPPVQGGAIEKIDKTKTPSLWKAFSDKNGNLLKNRTIKFEKLADTLEMIANNGSDAFYTGKIAKDLVRDVQEAGGVLTLLDLASYKARETDAWVVPMGEYQMYIPPPPSGGALLSLILNIMKGYQMKSSLQSIDQKTLFYHRYLEAFKFTNGLKKYIGDPNFKSEEIKRAKNMTEDSFANHIRSLITDNRIHNPEYYNLTPYLDSMGTTHVSVLAEDGSAVAVTSTINYIFGSGIYSSSTGIILNNQLIDFCRRTVHISPGEQPPSSMAPAVLKSDSEILVIGASGGSRITSALASALINHLWFGKSLKKAINASLVFVDSVNSVEFENDFDKELIETLAGLGHQLKQVDISYHSSVNAVEKKGGCVCAVSDERKQGEAAGY
ncbi:glutathione hydrolase 5 proenzyme-like isoform X1 [Fundulus heteroclitus]|uniref:glutathione hydrolase 5 proenzyme-like isoform X1 n=1 Tax=Fundulus heteroclitus TaxID=8078 RepID=UPI00165A349C|nr:glutathione hydrolase 5 proenzyme-like isoform X1 [Fundulus heteroclitus]